MVSEEAAINLSTQARVYQETFAEQRLSVIKMYLFSKKANVKRWERCSFRVDVMLSHSLRTCLKCVNIYV